MTRRFGLGLLLVALTLLGGTPLMADSIVNNGDVEGLVAQNGDVVDGFVQPRINGTGGTLTANSQTPAAPATLDFTLTIPGGSGTDNHIVRWDGTSNLQDSVWTIADTTGAMSGGASVQVSDGSDTVAIAAFPNPIVQLGDGTATMTTTLGSQAYDDGTNVGDLVFSAITGNRTWTLPDLTGTLLTDATPYASFPAFSGAQLLLGSDDGGTTSEIDLGTTLEIAGTTLRVAGDSIGPSQIDETANYALSGNNTHSGTEAFAADSTAFIPMPDVNSCVAVTSAGTVAFTIIAATSTSAPQIQAAWTGMGAAGSLQTADIYFPISSALLGQFGKACRVTSSTHCVSKTAGDANALIESSGIKQPTQTANSMTVSFAGADLVTDTTDRVTAAATDTDSFTIDWSDTAFSTSAPVYLRFQMARKAASASTSMTVRVAFDCANALLTFDNNS